MAYGHYLALRTDAIRRWDASEDSVFKLAGWRTLAECVNALLIRLGLPEQDDDETRVLVHQTHAGGYLWSNRDLCEAGTSLRAMLETPNPVFTDIEGVNAFVMFNKRVMPGGFELHTQVAKLMDEYSGPHLRFPRVRHENDGLSGNFMKWFERIHRVSVFLKLLYRHPKVVRPKILAFVRRVARTHILLGRVWKEAREELYKPGGAGAKRARQSFEAQLA